MVLQQPLHPVVGAAPFLVSRKSNDDVPVRLEALFFVLNEIGNPNRCLSLVVAGAAPVVEAVLFDELEGIHTPVFTLSFDNISVREKKNRFTGACAVIPGYEVGLFRDDACDENLGIGESCSPQPSGCSFRNRRSRTCRVAGLNFNKLFIDMVSK